MDMDNLDLDGMDSLAMLEAKREALIGILNYLKGIPLASLYVAGEIYDYEELIEAAENEFYE
jgi:hypothetical protein